MPIRLFPPKKPPSRKALGEGVAAGRERVSSLQDQNLSSNRIGMKWSIGSKIRIDLQTHKWLVPFFKK